MGTQMDDPRPAMLVMIEHKWRTLLDIAEILNKKLRNPTAPRAEIETHLAANGMERAHLLAKHAQIRNGSEFNFPKSGEIEALRKAISDLETAVAQTTAVETQIKAGNTVIEAMKADDITPS